MEPIYRRGLSSLVRNLSDPVSFKLTTTYLKNHYDHKNLKTVILLTLYYKITLFLKIKDLVIPQLIEKDTNV